MVRAEGFPREKIEAINAYKDNDVFTPLERAVLEYADLLTRTPAHIPEPLFDQLRKELNERQLVELTNAIAWENYRARFNRGFNISTDDLSR